MTIERRTGFSEDTFCNGTPCRLVTFGRYPRLYSTIMSLVIVIYETSLAGMASYITRNRSGFGKPANPWRRDGKLDSETSCNWLLALSLNSISPRLQLKFVIATAWHFQPKISARAQISITFRKRFLTYLMVGIVGSRYSWRMHDMV